MPRKRRASRADIVTMDTLAWAYYKNGQIADAAEASAQALRTGTRNARIRCHAEAIDRGGYFFASCTRRHSSLP